MTQHLIYNEAIKSKDLYSIYQNDISNQHIMIY